LYHGKSTRSPDEAGKLMMALDINRAEQDVLPPLATSRRTLRTPTGRSVASDSAWGAPSRCSRPPGIRTSTPASFSTADIRM
jgi:hypothetical protein